ncbi:MAG: signal peptidase I [Spirochaetia bacterium]
MKQKVYEDIHFFLIILLPVFILILIKLFFLDIMRIDGGSMEPVYREEQVIFVNRAAYGLRIPQNGYIFLWAEPEKNDIVVFRSPADSRIAVKRCIATSGDIINITESSVIIGEERFKRNLYLIGIAEKYDRIPEGYIFVVGDNRAVSLDSRNYGFLPVRKVIGKVMGER